MNQDVADTPPFLVFTDLDGSLMEHETYSIEAARPALAALADRGITPIFASSKTAAEIISIQASSGLTGPFICENGAAIYEDSGENAEPIAVFGARRDEWLTKVHDMRASAGWKFSGFADWSNKDVSRHTGLPEADAELARQREFTEPVLWQDTQANFQLFLAALAELDLTTLEGGRFISIQSGFDKSNGMKWWQSRFADPKPFLVALGDSPNDESLLAAADVAVAIKSAKSDQLEPAGPQRLIRTKRPGPPGWNDAMNEILALFDTAQLLKD